MAAHGHSADGAWPDRALPPLDALLEGFQVIGRDWRYVYVNAAAARHGRTTPGALMGRTMMECFPGIERTPIFRTLRRCMEHREARVLENAFAFPDGSIGHFELRVTPVPEGACVLSIDVTERHRAEARARACEEHVARTRRVEALGRLASGVAHDFNNLLSVVQGHGEMALHRTSGPLREDVEAMLDGVHRATRLTRRLLATSGRQGMRREAVDVAALVRGMHALLGSTLAPAIVMSVSVGDDVGLVDGDAGQIEQVVLNLVTNARDAMPHGGELAIRLCEADAGDDSWSPPHARSRHVRLSVSDTGIGMDDACRDRIFEPFFTTKSSGMGTGLGLAIVRGIVEQAGGRITVESAPGRGSTFHVDLPRRQENAGIRGDPGVVAVLRGDSPGGCPPPGRRP